MRYPRSHDYLHLIERWRQLALANGWEMSCFLQESGQELWVIESPREVDGRSLYFSAGIHGDEPASTEGLLAWVQRNTEKLRGCRFVIFPCLNPWGLIANTRGDLAGRDLNRSYNDPNCALAVRQKEWISGRRFDVAVMLHEDYDGTGFYLYEISRSPWGAELVAAARPFVGVEARREIDGLSHEQGVVRRELDPEFLEGMPNHPEAVFLAMQHSNRCYTVETPSEHALEARVEAHGAVLDRLLSLVKDLQ